MNEHGYVNPVHYWQDKSAFLSEGSPTSHVKIFTGIYGLLVVMSSIGGRYFGGCGRGGRRVFFEPRRNGPPGGSCRNKTLL